MIGPALSSVSINLAWVVLGACCAILATAGVWLIYGRASASVAEAATTLLCMLLAVAAFFVVGFGLAMGGVSGSYSSLGPLLGLDREWVPLGVGKGLLGLQGFLLSGVAYEAGVYALFLSQAGLLMLAASIAFSTWVGRVPRLAAVLLALIFGGLLYPLYTNWVWGGGWLAHLGQTYKLGHGVVDFAGSGVVNAAAGLVVLGGLLAAAPGRAEPEEEGTAYAPLVGSLLATAGWIGIIAAGTFSASDPRLAVAGTNALIAVVFAGCAGLLYTWFAGGEPHLAVGAQAGLAGLVAVSAGAPFYPAWAAAVAGGIAGLFAPLAGYVVGRAVRSASGGAIVAVHAIGGLWGLLAVGLMADGRYGIGWNGIGEREYLGVVGQGVTGAIPAGPVLPDPSQFSAQVVGCAALLLFPIAAWLLISLLSAVLRPRVASEALPEPSAQANTGVAEEEASDLSDQAQAEA